MTTTLIVLAAILVLAVYAGQRSLRDSQGELARLRKVAREVSEREEAATVESLGIYDAFSLHERCLQEGVCPRGCGPLATKSYNERSCPKCGFRHYNVNPERAPHATE
jgi:hypothetical protein